MIRERLHPPAPDGAPPGTGRLALGLAALGRPGYLNLGHGRDLDGATSVPALERRAAEVLDAAWRAGIRRFDAARSYGRAEAFLAGWLAAREVAPEAAVVSSKWGYAYTANWRVDADTHEEKELSRARLERQERESRALLGPHLDLYQIHSATLGSGVLQDDAVLDELARLRRERGVAIGLSLSGPRQAETLDRALAVERDGRGLFDAVQATWNPLEPSAAPALAEARRRGLLVMVKETLANGRLAGREVLEPDREAVAGLQRGARRLGVGLDAFALAACLARPWADVVLIGPCTTAQLASNLRALEATWDDEAEAALEAAARPAEAYWRERSELPWT